MEAKTDHPDCSAASVTTDQQRRQLNSNFTCFTFVHLSATDCFLQAYLNAQLVWPSADKIDGRNRETVPINVLYRMTT